MDVKLVMFRADGQRKDLPLISSTTVIGRAENCDLRIPLLAVSRQHCELLLKGGDLLVRDLASSNGTYVNNQRVNEAALTAGDCLVVGPIIFTVQIDGKPGEVQPIKTVGQRISEEAAVEGEEIVDLERDVIAQPGASSLAEDVLTGEPLEAMAIDPNADSVDLDLIRAAEALAAEDDDEQ